MKLCATKHYWCRSRYLCVCLLESWTPGESIVFWTHFVCLTSSHGVFHSRIGTPTLFSNHFDCETICSKIAKGTTDPRLELLLQLLVVKEKNPTKNHSKLLTSKLRALIEQFCRQAMKMLMSSYWQAVICNKAIANPVLNIIFNTKTSITFEWASSSARAISIKSLKKGGDLVKLGKD